MPATPSKTNGKSNKRGIKARVQKVIDSLRVVRTDTWANAITGFGTTRDKVTYAEFDRRDPLDEEQLEALYNQDDMASRVCDVMPEESLRQGFLIRIEAKDDQPAEVSSQEPEDSTTTSQYTASEARAINKKLHKKLKNLHTIERFIETATWARLFGGAAILLGVEDGTGEESLDQPLNLDTIQSVNFLNIVDKRYLMAMKWDSDPMSPNFGLPSVYMITPQPIDSFSTPETIEPHPNTLTVHASRLIVFDGARVTTQKRQSNNGFGESVLERFYDPLRQFQITWQSITHLIQDAPQGVFKIQGLIDMISSGDAETIQTRMEVTDMGRSVARAIVLDAEMEEFMRQATTFTDIPDLLDKVMIRLSAAARMPVTILMGQSPAGLDATGESDIRWFYDGVRSYQQEYLQQKLEYLVELIFRSAEGPTDGKLPENWEVEFPSLWQLSPLEEADLRLKTAEMDKIYIEEEVLYPEEIAYSRFGLGGYNTDTTVDLSTRGEIIDLKLEKHLKFIKDMPQFGLPKGWQAQFLPTAVPGSAEEQITGKQAAGPTGAGAPPKITGQIKTKTDEEEYPAHVHMWIINDKQILSESSVEGAEFHSHWINGGFSSSTSRNEEGHTHSIELTARDRNGEPDYDAPGQIILSGPPRKQ